MILSVAPKLGPSSARSEQLASANPQANSGPTRIQRQRDGGPGGAVKLELSELATGVNAPEGQQDIVELAQDFEPPDEARRFASTLAASGGSIELKLFTLRVLLSRTTQLQALTPESAEPHPNNSSEATNAQGPAQGSLAAGIVRTNDGSLTRIHFEVDGAGAIVAGTLEQRSLLDVEDVPTALDFPGDREALTRALGNLVSKNSAVTSPPASAPPTQAPVSVAPSSIDLKA